MSRLPPPATILPRGVPVFDNTRAGFEFHRAKAEFCGVDRQQWRFVGIWQLPRRQIRTEPLTDTIVQLEHGIKVGGALWRVFRIIQTVIF